MSKNWHGVTANGFGSEQGLTTAAVIETQIVVAIKTRQTESEIAHQIVLAIGLPLIVVVTRMH